MDKRRNTTIYLMKKKLKKVKKNLDLCGKNALRSSIRNEKKIVN